jgi:glycerol-3-phosphate O-acyltransferase
MKSTPLARAGARPLAARPHAARQARASCPAAAAPRRPAAAAAPRRAAAAAASAEAAAPAAAPATPFAGVRSETELFGMLKAGASSGSVPPRLIEAFNELYANYKAAVLGSGVPGATGDFVARVMASVVDRVLLQLNPATAYTFPSRHTHLLEPYNYYAFGQRYIRGLVDFRRSFVGGAPRLDAVAAQLAAGENVVLLANHQTEADPSVFALLLEAAWPHLAAEVAYVAGDRVVTDPLVAPFSMGRNLFCVHSKKHLDDVPELKAEKQATNRRTLKAMQGALAEGGCLLWIAPSGGRDRAVDPATGENTPDPFDPTAVELMRALLDKAKPPGHLYPFAMFSYGIMPPPASVDKSIGEARRVFHAPCGVALGAELDVAAATAGVAEGDKEGRQRALAEAAYAGVVREFEALRASIRDPAAAPGLGFSQPWAAAGGPPALDAGFD